MRFLSETKSNSIATIFLMVAMLLLFVASCKNVKKETLVGDFNPDSSYIMRTTGVESLISDSGVTRYKIKAKEWLVFSKAKDPYSYFPEGVYVEKFDSLFNIEASVKADTAYHWSKKGLWKLIGNVEILNLNNERFETSEMFWDEKKERIYSDKYVRIIKNDQTIIGKEGFESNQDMTKYMFINSEGSFPVSEKKSSDSTSTVNELEVIQTP
jgi:LPS export ABC transporter protein LptC